MKTPALKMFSHALASVSRLEHCPIHQRVVGSIPSQSAFGRQPIDVSHINFSQINKYIVFQEKVIA